MATEEEAREAADGEEVQVEVADLGTTHLQVNLDSKLSSHGDIKDKGKIMDSTEGFLRVTEDQVFEKAPSVAEIPPQHTPNGTASSLNGHMKEAKISNERPQENGQNDNEKVEASSDGINTDQSNKSNGEETVDSFDHIESTTEDTSLLKYENELPKEHYQQDVEGAAVEDKMVHKDTLQADEPTVDAQQGQNLELAEVTEDTQHASTSCNPHDEVVADAPAGVQTSLEPNADDSAPLPDATDGNIETEPAKVDKESFPEDEDIAEHTNEIIKLEDQPSKQADDVDADLVQEEVPKSKKTDMPEDMTTTEQAHESTNGDQEVLNQESPEDTSDPVHEKTEETSHESNVSAFEETTPEHDATAREPALDVQEVQSQGLAEEIADAKEVDTEKTVQESGVAFEEATSEDNIPTIKPSSDIQHPNNVESEEIKGLEDTKAEETSNQSNVTIAEDTKDKEAIEAIQPVQGLEEEPKNSGTAEMDEASNEPPDVLNILAEEDGVPACQPQVIELEEVKDTGVTETQEITQQSHVAASEELETEDNSREIESSNDDSQLLLEQGSVEVKDPESSETQEICNERSISASEDHVEDDVTAEGPTSDAQKVKNVESAEEIKDNTADDIVEASNVATVEEADQQNNVLTSEDVSEQKMRGLEPEEIQNTGPVETEEASDQRHPALFNNPAQEDIIPSDMLKTESTAEVAGIEATKTKAFPQESNVSISDESASEENATASEITCDAQEVNNLEQAEDVEGNKDTRTKETSDQSNESNVASLEEIATEESTTILTDISTQQLEEQEPVEFRGTETTEPQGISPSHIVSTSEDSASEDKVTAEPSPDTAENLESAPVTKETKDVNSTDAIAEEETPEDHVQELEAPVQTPPVEEPELEETKNTDNQMDATVLENPTHEDDPTTSESLVIESAEGSSSGATEGQEMPQSEVARSEDHEAEENTTASEPGILEPEPADEMRDSEATVPQSISQQSIVSSSEESVPEEDVTAREPVSDTKEVQTEEPELIDEHNDVKAGEISNQSSGTIVGEAAQENLESAIVTEEIRDVKSIDAIAEKTPELEETKNTEPVELHDNVMTNDLPAEEVKDTQATEIAEIHNESSDLTEDVKSNVAFTDETAPDEHAKATEATADIPRAQDPEPEETKNSEPVEVEGNTIASDLPEEEINDTEAMEPEVTHDESTSAKITELTNDALAEEATPGEPVIETEATIVIPRAQEPELEDIKDTKTVEVEENISATDQSAEEIEATDDIETEAINESINANNSELTEDVTAKEPASDVKEVQAEEPELIDEPNDVKAGEISNQSRRTIVGEAAQENLESATGTEETREVKSTDVIAEEKTAEELVQEFEGPVDIPPVEEPELEETKNTEPVEVHDNVTTNELPAEEVNDTEATEIAEIQNECADLTEDVKSNVPLADQAAPDEHAKAIEATADIPQVQEPELEDIKNSEHVEVEDNIIASDLPKEEIKDIEAMETEMIPDETTGANISELTNAVKSNVALAEEAAPEEHGTETEATIDIPQAQEPELEEVKNTEPGEVEENISATDQSAEEIKASEAMETEAVHESIDANNSKLAEDVERNSALEDDAAHEEHVIAAETTVQIPRAQEPELEEIKNSEPVEVKENISASDLSAEEVNETEATENKVINENTDANISEPTEDANRNVAVANEAAPEEHVIATEATVDIPRAQEPELEEIKNAEHVEVEENITATDLPAEEVEETEDTETEVISESTDANISEPTEDANRNVAVADEATPEEHVIATEATADIPPAQEPELEEIENAEHVEVEENIIASNLPAEEVKETQDAATEVISESTDGKINEPTDDVKKNGAVADEEAPEEHLIATEATVDIPRAQEPGIEEIENAEHVEVEENISASDLPAEEVKETEVISDSTDANITEPTEDAKINVALAAEAAPEHVIATEATVDIPRAQEPELEEAENAEHFEVDENISANDLPAEEVKETEVISDSTDANITEPTEDAKINVALAAEAAPEQHVIATEATVDIPRAQEPELEEAENAEHFEVEENISANDLPAEEVKETEVISKSTDANITEPTEDAKINVALAEEAAPEQHVIATEATVDIPRAQEPELEETENAEHFEVEENISANDLPAEEVKGTETMETGAISDSTDANITELTEDVALANEAVPDVHVDIPPAQEPALEEINNTEPVEAEDSITADDVPAEEINETKFMETEEIPDESTDDSLTESAPLADIQQAPEQETVKDKCTDTTQNQGEPQQSIVSTAAEPTRTEEKPTVTELASDVQVHEQDSTEETTGIEDVQTEDDQQHRVSNLEKPVSENDVSESEPNVADQEVQEDKTAEVEDTAAMEAEEISTQDNIPTTENATQESNEPGNDPDLLVQSEDIKEELLKAEETGQRNGATLEAQTAEDNAANETDPLADTKQVHGLESVKEYSGVDATEGEEASHPTSQDAGLEELVSESNVATEPNSDIQQVDDLDEAGEMTATEAINDEEISYPKTEVATLEDPSPTDNGMSPKQNSVELDEETLGTEINNAEPIEQKDESSDVGEKTAFTTQKSESPTEEDDVQSSGDDTVGISNNIEQIKEQSKAVTEDDAIKSGEHTIDQDDEQLHSVELQMQVCERSVDVSAIEQPDDDVQKVNLGQQQTEDEVIKEQAEEIQRDEQKHDDSSTELTTETLLEHQSNEIGTTNWNEDTDMFEAEKTETVATEMLMNEQTPHIQQGSTPAIADAKVANSTEIKETPEQENAPNNTGTLYTDANAENHNEDEKENLETDAAVVKPSTDKQDGTTDETEVGNGLTSSAEKDLQKTSDPAPSNEQTLENIRTIKNPTVVPRNVEPKVHSEEKACINKANDGMQAIQASHEEIVDEVENKQEMQNEDTCVNNDEIQTKPLNEDASELHSNDSTDTKMDNTISPYAEMTHGRIDAQPTEIEEVEENKGFRTISEYAVQCSNQNDVEHNLSIHPKVVDDNLATTEQNDAEVEINSNEEMATSYTAVTEAVKFDEAIDNKANGADGALSDENLETSEDNRRNLEPSSAVTSLGESMNEGNEHHNLALPAHSAAEQASGLKVTERGLLFPEKPLPAESEEHEESQTTKEQDEEDLHEQETSDTEKEEKEAEQSDLPVSNFLMNLIMGKESPKPDSNLETEAEMKQEETTKDDSGLINSQQEESLVPIPTENKVDNKLIFEQGKHNLEGSEETHDFKLETDEELSRNTHELEAPVSQNNVQDEISGELVPGGPGLMTEVESRNVKLGERATNSVCQEHMEVATQIEGGLKSNIVDPTNPKASQKNTLEGTTDLRHESLPEEKSSDAVARQTLLTTEPDTGDDLQSPLSTNREESTESSIIEAESTMEAEPENEVEKEEEKHHTINKSGSTGGERENLHDDLQKGTEAISDEKTSEITELDIGTEINLVDEKEISAGSKCEDKKQSSYELPNSELDSSQKALDIQSDGSSLHLNQDKQDEFAGDQIVVEKNSLLDKPVESSMHEEQETEIGQKSPKESDGGDQNCLAIREPVFKEENVNRTVESYVQTVNTKSNEEQETFKPQVQERDFDVVSAKEALEAEENFVEMAKPELSTDEEQNPKEDKLNMAGEKTYDEKTKDGEEAKSFTDEATTKIEEQGAVQKASHNQTRDLNVVLPTKTPGSEESFVDIKMPEFSTDEEQSPKKDEPKMAEEKSSDKRTDSEEEAKNFTDETPIKIEEREAGQKASPKKHNILSGVGSKVKHQLAKVKKAIIGKPGHTKSELAKS